MTIDTDRLQTYEAFPAALRQRLSELDDATLRFRPAPGEWSIIEIVGHYGDIENIWGGRVRQMLAAEHPSFPPFTPDPLVADQRYQEKQLNTLLNVFAERRSEQAAFLRTLRPAQLERGALHPTRGEVKVGELPTILTGHDQLHLNQIEANLAAYRGAK